MRDGERSVDTLLFLRRTCGREFPSLATLHVIEKNIEIDLARAGSIHTISSYGLSKADSLAINDFPHVKGVVQIHRVHGHRLELAISRALGDIFLKPTIPVLGVVVVCRSTEPRAGLAGGFPGRWSRPAGQGPAGSRARRVRPRRRLVGPRWPRRPATIVNCESTANGC